MRPQGVAAAIGWPEKMTEPIGPRLGDTPWRNRFRDRSDFFDQFVGIAVGFESHGGRSLSVIAGISLPKFLSRPECVISIIYYLYYRIITKNR